MKAILAGLALVVLAVALACFFSANPRVTVEDDPSLFWFREFGATLIGATHGHTVKPDEMPGVMAAHQPEAWGRTRHRYFYHGHLHHRRVLESAGVVVECFQTLAARDAWAAGRGYAAGRSMTAITLDRAAGERFRHTVAVKHEASHGT